MHVRLALTPGIRLGPYEIVVGIGAGGMGEVFRARDSTLNRDVAIKVLPDAVANDPERLARFNREAQTLAALNHPHIGQLYSLEEFSGLRALVMELVEGEDLSQRIARGPMPLDEALLVAKQIADAIEAAHDQGIVHRDLKPANIKLRSDGVVKVLDFGLAKAMEPVGSAPNVSQSPTITTPAMLTDRGMILGTAAYMAPEQARGKAVDRRADIWAFGCVLFEMLVGVSPFRRDNVTDTIAAVVSQEPDWPALTAAALRVRPLLARCLKKDPKQRLQAIGDARIQIEEMIGGASEQTAPAGAIARSPRVAPAAIAGLAGGALIAALVSWGLTRPVPPPQALPSRFEIVPPPAQAVSIHSADRNVAISPDGRHIVYRAGPPTELVVRGIDRLDAHPIDGTAGARYPFFSPDGQWVGFFDGSTLKKVSLAGGPAITICQSGIPRGASWGDDGTIVFATQDTATGLLRVSAGGGEPTVLTRPEAAQRERDHMHPSLLPNGRGILFTLAPLNPAEPWQVAVLDLRTGQRKTIVHGGSQPEYVSTGHLLYVVAGTLSAVRFDLDRLEVLTDPVLVLDNLGAQDRASADYMVSQRGTLVHVNAGAADAPRSLVWVDRTGTETPIGAPLHIYSTPRLSPDRTRIAVTIREQQNDINVLDLKRGTLMRLASSPSAESQPIWTRDSQRIVFASERDGPANLYAQAADGTGRVERLTSGPDSQLPAWVAPDGSGVLGSEISPKTAGDVVWFPLTAWSSQSGASPGFSANSRVDRLVHSAAIEFFPEVSPDGRYLAYQSNESGPDEIYVRPFPRVNDSVWHVSTGGGTRPAWAINGRELFYLDSTNALTAVSVQRSGGTLVFGNPARLFDYTADRPYSARDYDVAADGRFLIVKRPRSRDRRPAALVVVLNWFEELRRLLPAN
jgi:Tol biopolymer transport system component